MDPGVVFSDPGLVLIVVLGFVVVVGFVVVTLLFWRTRVPESDFLSYTCILIFVNNSQEW